MRQEDGTLNAVIRYDHAVYGPVSFRVEHKSGHAVATGSVWLFAKSWTGGEGRVVGPHDQPYTALQGEMSFPGGSNVAAEREGYAIPFSDPLVIWPSFCQERPQPGTEEYRRGAWKTACESTVEVSAEGAELYVTEDDALRAEREPLRPIDDPAVARAHISLKTAERVRVFIRPRSSTVPLRVDWHRPNWTSGSWIGRLPVFPGVAWAGEGGGIRIGALSPRPWVYVSVTSEHERYWSGRVSLFDDARGVAWGIVPPVADARGPLWVTVSSDPFGFAADTVGWPLGIGFRRIFRDQVLFADTDVGLRRAERLHLFAWIVAPLAVAAAVLPALPGRGRRKLARAMDAIALIALAAMTVALAIVHFAMVATGCA
jgi:hypothetical protein